MAEMLHDPAHLAVLAFADGNAEPGIAGHLPVESRVDLAIADAIDGDPAGKRCQCLGIDMALHPHPVFPRPSGAGKFKMTCQPAIIGQQQQAFGIHVQPPDRQHPRQIGRQMVKDGLAVLLVTCADNQPARLVITPQNRRFARRQRLAIDRDDVR